MGTQGEEDPKAAARSRGVRREWAVLAAVALLFTAGSANLQYTVRPGDTLIGIAQRHGTTVSALMGANEIGNPRQLAAGTTITVPGSGGATGTASAGGGGSTGSVAHHVVRPGETLAGIGRRYGVSAAQLAEWNGLGSTNTVYANTRISVGGPAAGNVATATSGSPGGTHRVAAGETLWSIATRTGVSVNELARANSIADPNRVVAGTTLTIPGAGASTGGWICPVRGSRSFVNDFGYAKPGGRFHNGVDVYAPRGTPVVAPVPGRVEHATGTLAGRQFRLYGVDGHVYLGTHLDSFGASGQVQAGAVLGTVGTSGNAEGTSPHLHFEIHENGRRVINPYPSLRTACG